MEKMRWQTGNAVGYVSSTIRKQREMNVVAILSPLFSLKWQTMK